MKTKRLIITTLLGLVFGIACYYMVLINTHEVSKTLAFNIILGRTLIGFVIGISRFPLGHWSIHGILLGLIFSLPTGIGFLLAPEFPDVNHKTIFITTLIMGMIFGFLIELITTVLFKARQRGKYRF